MYMLYSAHGSNAKQRCAPVLSVVTTHPTRVHVCASQCVSFYGRARSVLDWLSSATAYIVFVRRCMLSRMTSMLQSFSHDRYPE